MAQKNYTYRYDGITAAWLAQQVPGTGTLSPAVPAHLQTITWDEQYKDDLDAAAAAKGWTYVYEGTAPAAKTIVQSIPAFLTQDASSIATADGWVTVKSQALISRGGTSVGVLAIAIGNTSGVGAQAQARIRVSGGAYSNTVVGAAQYDIHNSTYGAAGFNVPVPLADTSPSDTTYTFELQMSVTGLGATVVPRAGSGMSLVEHR
jgi:hypothetical protein